MGQQKYDIFISYRRTSYETANLIATRLKAAGYSVFFDMETLRAGKFNEQLFAVIDNCKDFIVVLPPNALDRCVEEDDWVRLEVCRAMEAGKNIVPVMLNGFAWPNPMPQGMEELQNYQALTANSIEYFDMSIERLQKRYLKSKPHIPVLKFAKLVGVWIGALLAVLGIVYGVFYFLSLNVCQKYATMLANDASYVHIMVENNNELQKEWKKFADAVKRENKADDIAGLQEHIVSRIDFAEQELKSAWKVDSTNIDISDWHVFLLSLHGINAEEIAVSPVLATMYYTDYIDELDIMRNAAIDHKTFNMRFTEVLQEAFPHSINAYYASVLSELANFPESSTSVFKELSAQWFYFPKNYNQGEDREYYEGIIMSESKIAEELMNNYAKSLEMKDAELQDLENKNKELEAQMTEQFADLEARMNNSKGQADADLKKVIRNNEQELALRKEKVAAKKVKLEATKAELEELDKQYVQTYESLKAKFAIDESDDQWYKWGKIRRWGMFLNMVVESRKELEAKGVYSSSSITPEVIFADLSAQLTVYKTYHPESKEYVAAAKEYYKELSKGKRSYAGVLIFGFKDDATHPQLRKGDIILKYNGKLLKTYDEFKAAYKENKEGTVVYQRLENGQFVNKKLEKLEATDILGFLELTEQ